MSFVRPDVVDYPRYIVYDVSQVKLRYLLRVDFKYKR